MNFSIERTPLLEALHKVQSVVEKKNTVPILGNILCSVKNNILSLAATDLEVGIKVNVPVQMHSEGRITLAARHFLDIVRELPDKVLKIIKKENDWIEITCDKARFNIVSLSADQYPTLPDFEGKLYLEGFTKALMSMIDRTQFAASLDATRYQINGVYLESIEQDKVRMTATDGHRLSFVDEVAFSTQVELKKGVIIPKKGLVEFRKVLDQANPNLNPSIGVCFDKGHLFVALKETYLFIRLIDGEYPDYRPVIPQKTEKKLCLNRQAFSSALKRAALLATEKNRGLKLELRKSVLTITSSNPDMGEVREELDVQYDDEDLEIGFNSKYLLEGLNVMKAERLEFFFKNPLSPGILREEENPNHTYVIMPMRI